MEKLKALRSFTGDEKEGFVKRGSVFETTDVRSKALQEVKLAIPYNEPKTKEEKQADDKQTKEEKTAYQTKEQKVESKSKPGPKPKSK